MDMQELILRTIEKMQKAESLVIYGAGKRAELLIPFCESFVEKEKISIVVSKLMGG